jgi:hypothetical protein
VPVAEFASMLCNLRVFLWPLVMVRDKWHDPMTI